VLTIAGNPIDLSLCGDCLAFLIRDAAGIRSAIRERWAMHNRRGKGEYRGAGAAGWCGWGMYSNMRLAGVRDRLMPYIRSTNLNRGSRSTFLIGMC
jgi:hypothetical protein